MLDIAVPADALQVPLFGSSCHSSFAADTITIDLDDQDSRTVRRTTTQPVRSIKAAQSRKDSRVS